MSNPTGVSRAALREAAWEMQMIQMSGDSFFRAEEPKAEETIRSMQEYAKEAELIVLRILVKIEERCSNGFDTERSA